MMKVTMKPFSLPERLIAGKGRGRRRGSLMVEAAASVMMLAIAMTLTLKVVGWVALEHRATDRRQLAMTEAANLMERLTTTPYDELTPDRVKTIALSSETKASLPDPALHLEVNGDDASGGKGSKKISLRIQWRNRADGWDAPLRLTSWVYRSPTP